MRTKVSGLRTAFEDYQLAIARHTPRSQRWAKQKLETFFTFCEAQGLANLEEVTARDVRRFLADLRDRTSVYGRPLSSYTLHGYVQVVKGFFSWCEKDGLLDRNLVARAEQVRVDVRIIATFTPEQVKHLFAAARATRHPLRDSAILAVMFDTGIRASELCGLRMEHTHLTPQASYIQVFGKGRKERQVGLGASAAMALKRYQTRERPVSSLANTFVATGPKTMQVRGLESLFDRLGEAAHIAGVRCSPHDCRHTFAVNYMRAGGNIYALSKLLGHSGVQVTENYLRSFGVEDARQSGISVLDALWA
jgi:site-specific recombinase XerD